MTPSAKILIAEDELLVAMDLERRLRKMGHEVCGMVSTGEDAIERAEECQADLVLMDICLGGTLDGIEAATRITAARSVPVIYLTANADENTLQRAKLSNPSSYLLKPFRERELQICIEMALQNHRLREELRQLNTSLDERVHQRTAELLTSNEALRAEMEARRKVEQLAQEQAALLDRARDAIFARSLDGRITYWNTSAERMYDLPRTSALGRQVDDHVVEMPRIESQDPFATTVERGEWVGEMSGVRRDGLQYIVESRWTLVRDDAGRPTSILVVNTDISDRKRLEENQLRAERMESIGALASGIAHDLNNVFTPLIMSAQLLEDDPNPKVQESAQVIRTSAERGASIVKQVLLFARGGHGATGPFRLEHLANEVMRLLREGFSPAISFSLTFTPELWSVMGDSNRIHQVLTNLCVNARDAMRSGGRLTLRLENFTADEVYCGQRGKIGPGRYVCISVQDTGGGMSPEIQARIFEPFFTTKGTIGGTGLGLANVRAIVQEHNGDIEVESIIGTGTTFRLYLPACSTAEVTGHAPDEPGIRGNGEHVLLVDDEHAVREIVATTLRAHGYHVITANDGLEGLTILANQATRIDAVVTDLVMPNLDGLSLARAAARIAPGTPVVLASGTLQPGHSVESLREQGCVLLQKPFTAQQLLTALHDRLHTPNPDVRSRVCSHDLPQPVMQHS